MSMTQTLPKPQSVEIVATNVRAIAAARGLSAAALARAIGVTPQGVMLKWQGKRAWSLNDFDALSEVLDVEPWQLCLPNEVLAPRRVNNRMAATLVDDGLPVVAGIGFEPTTSGFTVHPLSQLLLLLRKSSRMRCLWASSQMNKRLGLAQSVVWQDYSGSSRPQAGNHLSNHGAITLRPRTNPRKPSEHEGIRWCGSHGNVATKLQHLSPRPLWSDGYPASTWNPKQHMRIGLAYGVSSRIVASKNSSPMTKRWECRLSTGQGKSRAPLPILSFQRLYAMQMAGCL